MKKNHNRRGTALVELAFVTPLMILLLLGGAHFGYLFYLYNALDKAVSDGARYAATRTYSNAGSFNCVIQQVVVMGGADPTLTTPVVKGLTKAMVTVSQTLPAGGGRPERIKVSISGYPFTRILGSGTLTLNGKPSMEVPFIGLYQPDTTVLACAP